MEVVINEANIFEFAIVFIASLITVLVIEPMIIEYMRKKKHTGIDVHKLKKIEVAESGGLGIIAGITTGTVLGIILFPSLGLPLLSFVLSILIGGIIGYIDDMKPLSAKIKPILIAGAGLPIILLQTYVPYLQLPFVGHARLFIVYPLLVLLGFSVASNAVNMLDIYNGSMPVTTSIVIGTLLIVSIISQNVIGIVLTLITLGTLLGYYKYNKYPAKVFSGDTGSLAVGSAITAIAVLARLEIIAVIAMIPFIINSYEIIASVGGLKERREMKNRPIRLRPDGKLEVTEHKKAPVTLARLVLVKEPLYEYEVVKVFGILTVFSGVLAIITFLFMSMGIF